MFLLLEYFEPKRMQLKENRAMRVFQDKILSLIFLGLIICTYTKASSSDNSNEEIGLDLS